MLVIIPLWPFFFIAKLIWKLLKWCGRGILRRIKKRDKGELYIANLWHEGKHLRRKTFFPNTWTEEEMADAVIEAYSDFQKKGAIDYAKKSNSYVLRGVTKEGIEIEIHVSNDRENMLAAYPIF